MKTPTMRRVCLMASLLFAALTPAVQSASITVDNQAGYDVGLALLESLDGSAGLTSCGSYHPAVRFPSGQKRTADLESEWDSNTDRCNNATISIHIYTLTHMYDLPYENRYPDGFKRVQRASVVNGEKKKEAVWLVQGGLPGEANRPFHGDLRLVMRGTVWWATVDEYTVTRDFKGMNLSEVNLSGANLSGTDFGDANLVDAKLSNANLRRANLMKATLDGADLRGANLTDTFMAGATLSKADLSGTDMSALRLGGLDMSGANLSKSNLSKAGLRKADLHKAKLSGADLSRTDMYKADLRGADLSGADLRGADLTGADLRGADLTGSKTDAMTICPNNVRGPCW